MKDTETIKIRILIADDQRLVREGIASLLSLDEGFEIAGLARNGNEAVEMARKIKPDVLLLDIRMPGLDGIGALEKIREEKTVTYIIMLTTFDDDEYIMKSLRAGAAGYLLKDLPAEDLGRAIRLVFRGIFQTTSEIMGKLLGRIPAEGQGSGSSSRDGHALTLYARLSRREKDVLSLIGRGATNREIASELGLSEGTIKNYVSGILDNLGFRDRIQLALFSARNGLSDQ